MRSAIVLEKLSEVELTHFVRTGIASGTRAFRLSQGLQSIGVRTEESVINSKLEPLTPSPSPLRSSGARGDENHVSEQRSTDLQVGGGFHDALLGGFFAGEFAGDDTFAKDDDAVADGQQLGEL